MALFPNWNGSASASSYRCFPTCGPTWCSATTARTFPAPTMTWNAAFAGSRPSTAASVVARIGTPISYATGERRAYAAWWEQDAAHRKLLEQRAAQLDRTRWRELRRETTLAHSEQLTRFP